MIMLLRAWRIFSSVVTLVSISVVLAFALVMSFAREGPVIRRIGETDHPTTTLRRGGTLSYSIDVERLESCPGEVVTAFRFKGDPGAAVYSSTRPIMPSSYRMGVRPHLLVQLALPPAIGPGKWTYQSSVSSHCPTRERSDEIASFDIEVTE